MKISKITLFAFILIAGFFQKTLAQVNNNDISDSTDNDSAAVDPDYKPLTRSGNTVNGKWYGIGNVVTTNHTNSYLCELLLREDRKGNVTGYFNYFFRDGYFSNKLYGTYDRTQQIFKFKPVIVLFHQTVKADIGVDVPMYGNFVLNLNSKDTTLTGFLNPISNYKYLVPALNIRLGIVDKKEPTLKERIRKRKLELEEDADVATILNESTNNNKNKADKQINKGQSTYSIQKRYNYKNDTIHFKPDSSNNFKNDVIKNRDGNRNAKGHDVVKNEVSGPKSYGRDIITYRENAKKSYQADTIKPLKIFAKSRDTLKLSGVKPVNQRDIIKFKDQISTVNQAVEEEYNRRATNLVNTLVVKDDSVTVSLYDNGEFDHDRVSVFYNGKLVASSIELKTNAASKFVVYLDTNQGAKNELTLFAENLGTIPPNSALMIIEDTHGNRYEVTLKSDLSHNASVLLMPILQ